MPLYPWTIDNASPKPFTGNSLGLGGRARDAVSPLIPTTYDDSLGPNVS